MRVCLTRNILISVCETYYAILYLSNLKGLKHPLLLTLNLSGESISGWA